MPLLGWLQLIANALLLRSFNRAIVCHIELETCRIERMHYKSMLPMCHFKKAQGNPKGEQIKKIEQVCKTLFSFDNLGLFVSPIRSFKKTDNMR